MDVKEVGDHECIQCGECKSVCKLNAISWKTLSKIVKDEINEENVNETDNTEVVETETPKKDRRISKKLFTTISGIVSLVLLIVVIIGVLIYWFFGTEYGSSLRATGANPNMSRAQGININATKIFGLVLSNGIVALAGALLAQYQGNADINMGKGAIVIGLAAVIIGEALFGWFARNAFALKLITVVLGGIVYFIVYSTVIYLGLDSNYLKMLSAIVVAIFLAIPYWKKKYFSVASHVEKREQKESEKATKKFNKDGKKGGSDHA